jgi:hypothetical protein
MSHWKTAQCKLNCSLAVLRRALINIIPKWEKYIKTSESANLEIINTYTRETEKGYSLTIPQGGETGISYGDVGFKKNAKGEWEIRHDVVPYEIGNNFSGRLQQEVGAMKARAAIQMQGFTVKHEETKGGEKIIRFIRPANQAHQI